MAKKKSGKRKRAQDEDIALDYDDENSIKLGTTTNTTFLPLTGECHHYNKVGEVPFDIQKLVISSPYCVLHAADLKPDIGTKDTVYFPSMMLVSR
jgi:hypothetical protein